MTGKYIVNTWFLCYTSYMTNGGKDWGQRLSRWLDEWKIAASGIVLATRSARFLAVFAVTFVLFGILMNLLSGSSAALSLFWTTDLGGKMQILSQAFLAIFGVGRNFWDWALTFVIVVLQSLLIGLVALVWQKKHRNRKEQVAATASNSDNVQSAGLAAGLAVLGSGCPTCGTTLLAPVIGTLFSTSSYALASAISVVLTLADILVSLLTLKKLGNDAYALIVSERFLRRRSQHKQESEEKNE